MTDTMDMIEHGAQALAATDSILPTDAHRRDAATVIHAITDDITALCTAAGVAAHTAFIDRVLVLLGNRSAWLDYLASIDEFVRPEQAAFDWFRDVLERAAI